MLKFKKRNKILFIIATHGNEGYSFEIFQKLEKKYPKNKYNYDWIIGNELAYQKNVRYIDQDLNRSAPGDITSNNYELKRAAEIMEITNKFDIIIDIHGAISKLGLVTIIPKPSFENLVLASLLPIKKNLIWAAKESEKNGPLVQYISKPGIEIECGPLDSKSLKKRLTTVLFNIVEKNFNQDLSYFMEIVKTKQFYQVYGLIKGANKVFNDFKKTTFKKETFYPLLSGQYEGIDCYKMKKVDFNSLFIY